MRTLINYEAKIKSILNSNQDKKLLRINNVFETKFKQKYFWEGVRNKNLKKYLNDTQYRTNKPNFNFARLKYLKLGQQFSNQIKKIMEPQIIF